MTPDRDWRDGRAETIIVGKGNEPLVAFARVDLEDGFCWERRQVQMGASIGLPTSDRERLTPDELLDGLRRPLRAP